MLDELIKKFCKENGIKNFSVSIEENASKKGDNYLGNISLIAVRDEDTNNVVHLVLKAAETNPNVRAQMPIREAYEREVFLYETVLPTFEAFQQRHPMKYPFKAFTKLVGSTLEEGQECLLMENIKCHGFTILERTKTMDDQHISLVFREISKLHSISLAMNHLEPETYKRLTDNLKDYFTKYENVMKSFMGGFEQKSAAIFKIVEGNQKAAEAMYKLQNDWIKVFEEIMDENNHLVIVHGDLWCNNMMFKYDDQTKPTTPTSVCFLDWQISKTQNPVADLCYFLFFSGAKSALDDHRNYLDLYYQTIRENLQSIGCDAASIYPYELFQSHWKRFAKTGVFITLTNMQLILKEEKDAKRLVDLAEGGNDILGALWKDEEFGDEYCQRMKDIIFMMVENDYM